MARVWSEAEMRFLVAQLNDEESIQTIVSRFNDKFESRTYDSIQKKIKRLANLDPDTLQELFKPQARNELSVEQQETLDLYATVLKREGRRPTMAELQDSGITRSALRHRWGNLRKLEKAAREKYSDLFNEVRVSDIYTSETKARLLGNIESTQTFIITTAVTGSRVSQNFLDSIDVFCEENNAELLIMIASDPAHQWAHDDSLGNVDRILEDRNLIVEEVALNDNLYLSEIKLSAKQIDPVTGMAYLAQQGGSYMFASPKQRLQFVPVRMGKHPPAIMGTGAITVPAYVTDMYMSRRTGYMAGKSHVMGAIVVEVENNEIFHFRQVQADKDGSFIDWGIKYTPTGTESAEVLALICGDEHAGRGDPEVIRARHNLIEELQPKELVLHDLFDGRSISHHTEHKTITRAKRARDSHDDLRDELLSCLKSLQEYSPLVDNIVIVKSNHDEHLVRYLEDGRFLKDRKNYRISLDLAAAIYDGDDPVAAGLELLIDEDVPENILWLQRDQEYIVAGVELHHHGDRGPNGAKGGIKAFARTARASVTGHSHTAEIYGGAYRVGTSTGRLDYCVGPSSWTNTDCILYENGSRQLVNYINGKYRP